MNHLAKFTKQSTLEWVPRICSRERLAPINTLIFRSLCSKEPSFITCTSQFFLKGRILPSESRCLCGSSVLSSRGENCSKWASRISLKDQNLTSDSHRRAPFIKCVSYISVKYRVSPLKSGGRGIKNSFLGGLRKFCTETAPNDLKPTTRSPRIISQAQDALMDYLHFTAGLEFSDAEHMSKHSPVFLDRILKKLGKDEEEIGRATSRFLRYHPPNEFELLFESVGLNPCEFSSFLPRDLIYLKDDQTLLDNYHVLLNYGIDRGKMGRILKEANEAFKCEVGVLESKLKAYEDLGLSKGDVIKIIISSPDLLIGDVNRDFVKVLEELEDVGVERDWIPRVLSERNLYTWVRMPILLQSCFQMGLSKQEVGTLIRKHPDFLLDGSGKTALLLIGFLLKVGATRKELFHLLTQFPQVQVAKFMKNLREGLQFLLELEMDPEEIKKLLCNYAELFGQHTLKKASSVVSLLQTNNKRLRTIIKDDPYQLKKYVKGRRLGPLPSTRYGNVETCRTQKREFLLSLGFVDNSKEMQKALRDCRGKGDELQERYDFLVKCGLEPNDVCDMIRRAPNVLNQRVDVLERKINFLRKDLGFPISALAEFPKYLAYTAERVKVRFSMYNWLKDKGKVGPFALSTILACSDEKFRKVIINNHPQGPNMWKKFKSETYSN